MSERYARLFALPENLYQPGSPVMILAGALLKDNQTGGILALMKFKNVGEKPIRGLKVRFFPQDLTGIDLNQPLEHQYLDLNAARDGEFGQKEPVAFPNAITRAFRAEVYQVVFADGTLWNQEQSQWSPTAPPQALETALGDKELCKEYQILYGANCRIMPQEGKGLWRCACGAWNMASEANCHACGKNLEQLKTLDLEQLKASRDARVAREQQAIAAQQAMAAQQAAASASAQASSKGNRPRWLIPGIAALLVVLVGGGIFFVNRGKPASSGSGGGTQSAASDDSGNSASSDEDFVKDALHDFSEEMKDRAPGSIIWFMLKDHTVALGVLMDGRQFTYDGEATDLANEILKDTETGEHLKDGGFKLIFSIDVYNSDPEKEHKEEALTEGGYTLLEN